MALYNVHGCTRMRQDGAGPATLGDEAVAEAARLLRVAARAQLPCVSTARDQCDAVRECLSDEERPYRAVTVTMIRAPLPQTSEAHSVLRCEKRAAKASRDTSLRSTLSCRQTASPL
eukprot:272410-Rhodomonas_salina.2